MRRILGMLVAVLLVLSITSIALARGAPNKQAFASKATIEMVSPTVATVPVMIGYDVIENISKESRDLSIAQNTFDSRYIGAAGLSPTRAWRSINAKRNGLTLARSAPCVVLLA